MLYTVIKENSYQDSVNLMLLSNKLSSVPGIQKISVMMGTPANIDIFRSTGLFTEKLSTAKPNDMCIVVDTDNADLVGEILSEVDTFLANQAIASSSKEYATVRTWEKALKVLPNANIAIISVPGSYAAEEAQKAIEHGLHAFIFSDNVPAEEEARLKRLAHEKGLLVMGPDCGTGIISGVPLAFANSVREGNIGIVGASGTGIQEVTTMIDRLGGGVSHAIGTGGRDLSSTVGAITMMDSIKGLESHKGTDVVVVISKPPAKEVRDEVVRLLQAISKPVVAIFIGEKPTKNSASVHYTYTLEETALVAVQLAGVKTSESPKLFELPKYEFKDNQSAIKGLYSGGTLAAEAALLIGDALGVKGDHKHKDGYLLHAQGHEIIDLGDDIYTQGKPHPMIDPETRIHFIKEAARDEKTAVILFDVVLGYGSHDNMAGELAPAVREASEIAQQEGRCLQFIATVCGTDKDPQNYEKQRELLEELGVHVYNSNTEAVRAALQLVGLKEVLFTRAEAVPFDTTQLEMEISEPLHRLLNTKPVIVNVGLEKFVTAVKDHGSQVVQFDWRPVAGGNEKMRKLLSLLV